MMKTLLGLAIAVILLAPTVFAQEHYSEGPVWRVELVRVKPTHMDEYLASLQQVSKPLLDEEKAEGLILDYKLFLKETKNDPQDWDVCLAIQYKNHAAMDGLAAKEEAMRDKVIGGKQKAQQVGESREEYRELVSDELLQEILLK
jgi:hypothetical protein